MVVTRAESDVFESDVIVASASDDARRALVRISGPRLAAFADAAGLTFATRDARAGSSSNRGRVGDFSRGVAPARLALRGDVAPALPVLALRLPGPRSYTGEDVLELLLPGSPALVRHVIAHLLAVRLHGDARVRLAEPGEFTQRAFLAGRIGLDRAEAIALAIAARTDAELSAAEHLREGRVAAGAGAEADALATMLALVEAGIDFTDEEDVVAIAPGDLAARLDAMIERLRGLLASSIGTERLSGTPLVAFAGPPNAGKSSLFNALLRRERVVVADERGTTRDAIVEPIVLDADADGPGGEVLLADLPGLDVVRDRLDPRMQRAAIETLDRADVVLWCTPGTAEGVVEPPASLASRTIRVRTKGDRGPSGESGAESITTVVREGNLVSGESALRAALHARLGAIEHVVGADAIVVTPRHRDAIERAIDALTVARALVAAEVSRTRETAAFAEPELLAADLREALDALGVVAGAIHPDDVLGRVFASFCVGK